jgi:hypothetical protein
MIYGVSQRTALRAVAQPSPEFGKMSPTSACALLPLPLHRLHTTMTRMTVEGSLGLIS